MPQGTQSQDMTQNFSQGNVSVCTFHWNMSLLWRCSTGNFLFATMYDFLSYIVAHTLNMIAGSLGLLQPFQKLLWFLCVFAMLKKVTNNV